MVYVYTGLIEDITMQPYTPDRLPIDSLALELLLTAVGEANAALARYDGLLMGIVNPAVMLSPLTNQEAVLSSRIEGTQATIEEVLEHEAGQKYDQHKIYDIHEIINYRKALMLAKDTVASRPISLSLVKEIHATLMDSVRGATKELGQFRKDQNWIGTPGCTIEQATFVPPNPLQLLDHLQAWEQYLDLNDIDPILQAAVVHAQFELIHPFKDGNGRIGRLLIPLFLYSKNLLASPMFYLSDYLESNRKEYYSRLGAISQTGDWTGWCAFFLRGVIAQAKQNSATLHQVMALYEKTKTRVCDITKSPNSIQIIDALFYRPIFTISDVALQTDIPTRTIQKLVKTLIAANVIKTLREASGPKPAIFMFAELLNTVENREFV